MSIQWCTAQDIDSVYNIGVSASTQLGTLDGTTFELSVDTVDSTLALSCTGNAATQSSFLSALQGQWPGLIFTVNPMGQLYLDPNTHTVIIGAGTANAILGFSSGLIYGPVPATNAMSTLMFGTGQTLDPFWASTQKQTAITASIAWAGSQIESRLRTRYVIPPSLSYIPPDLVFCAAIIAGYYLIINRGFNPKPINSDIDAVYKERYDWAINEIHEYSTNRIHPDLQLCDHGVPRNWGLPSVGTALGVAGMASQQINKTRGY